jgi:hypothetical protein
MYKAIILTICTIFLGGCSKEKPRDGEVSLKEKFHGKYEIISSISDVSVDINMDGVSSNNLLIENFEVSGSKLELRILNSNEHLFSESWPVEYIVIPRGEIFDSTRYHPTYRIYYALHGYDRMFRFSDDQKFIQLVQSVVEDTTNTLIQVESLTVEEDKTIKVAEKRKLYTSNGWIKTRIVSTYRRYTKIT